MFVLALEVDLRLAAPHSLKEKRALIRPILDGARTRFRCASSEVGEHDLWQRARLGFAVVGPGAAHVAGVIDHVERFVWSFPEIEVLASERHWLEPDDDR